MTDKPSENQSPTRADKTGACPWCGKQNRPLFRTTALVPLKSGSEDMTVISEYVCAGCLSDGKAERFWIKRLAKEAFNG